MHQELILSDDATMRHLIEVWPQLTIQSTFDTTMLNNADQIFLTRLTNETLQQIEKVCQSYTCNWYWTNITYDQPARRWWQLFRRK